MNAAQIAKKAKGYLGAGHQNFGDVRRNILKAGFLPDGWTVVEDLWNRDTKSGRIPDEAIGIGSYRVRSHDPANSVYLLPPGVTIDRDPGRPMIEAEPQLRRNISLSEPHAERAREIGGGNISEGIRRALDAYSG